MHTDLDHLPARKQRELARVLDIIHEEFEDAVKFGTAVHKKRGRILKIVLFGSYARGGWVDEPHTTKGYKSDYDLLIVVSHKALTQVVPFWEKAEDRLMHTRGIKTPVNFIVHTMAEVNDALAQGQYFFVDIINDGISLYEMKGSKRFATPQPLTPGDAYDIASKHFENWFEIAKSGLKGGKFFVAEKDNRDAAFLLHQTVERLYQCFLLTLTNYGPASHNIKFLRSLIEGMDARMIEIWPHGTRFERRCFELLKKAYIEARYSRHYKITTEELTWIVGRVEILTKLVATLCNERLARLKADAKA